MGHRTTLGKIAEHLEQVSILAESVQDRLLGEEWSMEAHTFATALCDKIAQAEEMHQRIPKVPDRKVETKEN